MSRRFIVLGAAYAVAIQACADAVHDPRVEAGVGVSDTGGVATGPGSPTGDPPRACPSTDDGTCYASGLFPVPESNRACCSGYANAYGKCCAPIATSCASDGECCAGRCDPALCACR